MTGPEDPKILPGEQLIVSTAQEQDYHFHGAVGYLPGPNPSLLPPGEYRIVTGELYRVLPGPGPQVTDSQKRSR